MLKRVALLVGISDYSSIPRLKNPVNDTRALAAFLQANGFDLVGEKPLLNASRAQIEDAAEQFARRLGRDTVGVFYFSGHGLQLGGTNYLCPVEAGNVRETHVEAELVSVGRILQRTEMAQAALNIVILDACRSDPFQGRSFQSKSGFAPMQARTGTLLSFATQPGHVAFDGEGRNSPFIEGLLTGLSEPGLDALNAFNKVGLIVKEATQGRQVPWMANSPIETRFSFVEPPAGQTDDQANDDFGTGASIREADDSIAETGSLADQIAAAEPGSVLVLEAGYADGNIVIDRPVTIRSRRPSDPVVIRGQITVKAGPVSLEELRIEAPEGLHGVFVENGHVAVLDCAITTSFAPGETTRTGIVVQGESASVEMRGGLIEGFPEAFWCERSGRGLIGRGTLLRGPAQPGQSPRKSIVAITAHSGGNVRAERGLAIRGFTSAAYAYEGSTLELSDVRIEGGDNGVVATGERAFARVSRCRIEDVSYGASAESSGEIEVSETDIDASVSAIYGEHQGSHAAVSNCPHLCVTGRETAVIGIWGGARATISTSKVFGGGYGISAAGPSSVEAVDCEIFDVASDCVSVAAEGSATVSDCVIHRAKNGLRVAGKATISGCTVHNHDAGVTAIGNAHLRMDRSWIYSSKIGVFGDGSSAIEMNSCLVLLNVMGVAIMGQGRFVGNLCGLQQNSDRSLVLQEQAQGLAKACYFGTYLSRHPLATPSKTALTTTDCPAIVLECNPSEGSGGRDNSASSADIFYAPLSKLMDELQKLLNTTFLKDWTRLPPRTSEDGRTVTYSLSRDRVVLTKLAITGGLAGIRLALGGRVSESAHLTYQHRIEITVERDNATRDFDRLTVTVNEEEQIDKDHRSDYDIGGRTKAPSLLWEERAGCKVLMGLSARLMPGA